MMCVAYFHLMGLFHIYLTSCNEKPGDLDKKIKIKHRNCTWDYFVFFKSLFNFEREAWEMSQCLYLLINR